MNKMIKILNAVTTISFFICSIILLYTSIYILTIIDDYDWRVAISMITALIPNILYNVATICIMIKTYKDN